MNIHSKNGFIGGIFLVSSTLMFVGALYAIAQKHEDEVKSGAFEKRHEVVIILHGMADREIDTVRKQSLLAAAESLNAN